MIKKTFVLALIIVALGCVQAPVKNDTLVIDNVEYSFANDIQEARKIPVNAPDRIRNLLLGSRDVNIIFDCSAPEDKPSITVAAFNSVSTVQNYMVYSRARAINFYTFCFREQLDAEGVKRVEWFDSADFNVTEPAIRDATLWFRAGKTGAVATNVLLNETTIIIQGTDHKNLTLATDAFNLAFLGRYQ